VLRLVLAVLVSLSALLAAVGAPGALGLLLVAVPVAAAIGLYAVADVVDHGRSRTSVVLVAASLLLVVLAAAARRPELALSCLVCLTAESATRRRTALSDGSEEAAA
jgi:hypothetical protein